MDYEIEIVDAYEIADSTAEKDGVYQKKKARKLGWSVHVYMGAKNEDLRGVKAIRLSAGWFIQLPYIRNYDDEEKKWVYFPVWCPTDIENKNGLIAQIKEKAIDFIEKKLLQEQLDKEKKKIDWKTREKNNQEKLKKMSEKRNQNPKYAKTDKKIIAGKK